MQQERFSGLGSMFAELRRRRIFRVSLVYVLTAWIVIQVAVVVFPSLLIPDWATTLVTVLVILGFPLALVLAWATAGSRSAGREAEAGPDAAGESATAPPPRDRPDGPIGSVAVLPFVNMSADPEQEFFSDGMAEELLDALAKIEGLRVPARTSSFAFKGRAVDVREVGTKLGVEAVLEGSVRKSADRIRVTAQLVSAHDGYHLWSESYDRTLDDVFRIQEELARSIVGALAVRLPAARKRDLVQSGTNDVEAYTLVLKGRQAFARRDLENMQRALGFFEAAIERDPDYAAARSGLADVLWVGARNGQWPWNEVADRARAESARAVELAPDLAEAHTSRGGVLFCDSRGEDAAAALRHAIDLAPGYAQAHQWLASLEAWRGHVDESMRLRHRAASLDPLSRHALSSVGSGARDWQDDLETAAAWFLESLEVDPRHLFGIASLAYVEAERGRFEEARAWADRAVELDRESPLAQSAMGYVRALEGDREGAMEIVEGLVAEEPAMAAQIHMALGEPETGLALIERAAEDGEVNVLNAMADRAFIPLRTEPRFRRIVARLVGGAAPEP